MRETHAYFITLTGLALLALTTCGGEATTDASGPTPGPEPGEIDVTPAQVMVEVTDPEGRALVGADVAFGTRDGQRWLAATDGRGRAWFEAHPLDIAHVVASHEGYTFAAYDGALAADRVVAYQPITLELERRDVRHQEVSVYGKISGLVEDASSLMVTATVPDAKIAVFKSQSRFYAQLPAAEPFTLIGIMWRRPSGAPQQGILRELLGWAYADSGWPLPEALTIDLDFAPLTTPPWTASTPSTPMPWTRHDVTGTFAAPCDEQLAAHGVADLSVHFIGTDGQGYLGAATATEPAEEGFHYAASWASPIGSAVETQVTVRAGKTLSGAWLIGPPPGGEVDLGLLSPAEVTIAEDDAHGLIEWAASTEDDHDLTILHVFRDGERLGSLYTPPYIRSTALPVMPSWQAETELFGSLTLIVERCASDPVRDRCERFARTGPLALAPPKIVPSAF